MLNFLETNGLIKLLIGFAVIGLSIWLRRKTGKWIFIVTFIFALAYILLTFGVMLYFAISNSV
jgi:hypothetical protein